MSERSKVPVAYVTKWAVTRGIVVWKDAKETESGWLYPKKGWMGVAFKQWTEDKAIAEERYREALLKASQGAFKKMKAMEKAINAPPKYTEES
jgi:hypothetical protein